MATRIESTRNLVSIQSISFIRAKDVALTLKGGRPNTQMYVFFDNENVTHLCSPSGGAIGDSIVTDSNGEVSATFHIPGGRFNTGTKEVVITDSDNLESLNLRGSTFGSARADFSSNGISQIYQKITDTVTVEIVQALPPTRAADPLAQSFFTYGVKGGLFVTSIELYFNTKDTSIPVRVDIRPMENGFPTKFGPTNPDWIVTKSASDVNVSSDANTSTKFVFDRPVYLEEDKDYCFVVFSNSKKYNLFTSKIGEVSIETGRTIFDQPYVGSMFKSENNITWTAEQFEDIKFKINQANFSTASTGILTLKSNSDYFSIPGTQFSTTANSPTVRVEYGTQHGLTVTSKVNIVGSTGATYNGISSTNFTGNRSVTSVIDDYTFEYSASANASTDGPVTTGGQVTLLVVDSGGTGYTSTPTVEFSGGGGSGATATAIVQGGAVVSLIITYVGSGYTSTPTVTISGGNGSGATAVSIIDAVFSVRSNKPIDMFIPNIPAYSINSSEISATINAVTLAFPGSGTNTYGPGIDFPMNISGKTYLPTHSLIASTENDTEKLSGVPSVRVKYQFNTDNSNISPVIDLRNSPSLYAYSYRLNSQSGEDITATSSSGGVNQIVVSNYGSGYNVAPTVTIINGGGTGATAVAILGTAAINAINVTNGGTGYTSSPSVSFTGGGGGTGAAATAVLNSVPLATISLTSPGTNYTSNPTVSFTGGGGGTGAAASTTLSAVGVASIGVTDGGTGYTSTPTVAFSGGGGSGASATAVLSSAGVDTVSVTNGGSGYTSAPTVAFSGGGGTGAAATAVITGDAVTSVNMTSAGSGYTSTPTISFSGGAGTGAAATAVLQTRTVQSITVDTAGSGYTSAPTITITNGGGSGATATAVLESQNIASITLTNPGFGYTVPPTVAFSGGGGTGAAASTTLQTRVVQSVTIDNVGSGYTAAPTVVFAGGGGTGAAATASIAGRSLSEIQVTNAGSNYTNIPEVVITRTDGSTGVDAVASATLSNLNSEVSPTGGSAISRYVTKKISLDTPSTGIKLFSEIYSESSSSVDWYIRMSLSGTNVDHESLDWTILKCDESRNKSSKKGDVFDYTFYLFDQPTFDVYDLKCVMRSSNPVKAPEVNNYRVIAVA